MATAKQEIIDLVQGNRGTGSLRVGVPPSVCQGVMGAVIQEFSVLYPNVDLTVVEAYSRNLTEQLQAGELDVALGALPPVDLYKTRHLKLIVPTERRLIGNTVLDFVMSGQLAPAKVMKIDRLITTLE